MPESDHTVTSIGCGGDDRPHWSRTRKQARTRRSEARTPTGAFLCRWLEGRLSLRPSTLASYRTHIERHLIPAIGHVPLRELRPETIQRAYHQLLADGMTPATLGRVHATLSAALNNAARQNLLSCDPLADVELPTPSRAEPLVWTLAQACQFLVHVRGAPLEGLWRLALITGMRRGELCALKWTDIDLDRGQLRVRANRVAVGGLVVEGHPKSRAGRRTLHLDPQTVRVLRTLRAVYVSPSGHVFTDEAGQPLTPWGVSRRFTRTVEEAGLPKVRMHDLRHVSATIGLALGESLKAVSTRLGHSDIATTANIYGHVPDETARRDTLRLADHLDGDGADE